MKARATANPRPERGKRFNCQCVVFPFAEWQYLGTIKTVPRDILATGDLLRAAVRNRLELVNDVSFFQEFFRHQIASNP